MAVKLQVDVFWVVMPCSVVAGYQHFMEVHAASIFIVTEAAWTPETSVSYHNIPEDLDLNWSSLLETFSVNSNEQKN
jgi:hypothetical protein